MRWLRYRDGAGWARLRRFGEALLEWLYPPRAACMGCGSLLGTEEGWLCGECLSRLEPLYEYAGGRCPRCGGILEERRRCGCEDWPEETLSFARFAYVYAPPVNGMVRRFKYRGVWRMRDWMAGEMWKAFRREGFAAPDLLVPVPMHARRLRQRGYNQAALLAEALGARMGCPTRPALERRRDTRQQARLDAAARRVNLLGAFAAREDVRGLRILLIDDVLTTGSTACECARALRLAGAKDVQLLTLAGAEHR